MAGEFNLYSEYAKTQAPISQFVPDNMPWELILKQGAQKQAMQDQGEAFRQSLALQGDSRYVEDDKYLKQKQDAVKALADEYAGKEMTSHTISELANKFKALKEDKGLGLIAARTKEYDDVMKTIDDYAKDPNKRSNALLWEDFYKTRDAYNKSGKFDETGLLTNVNVRAGVSEIDEGSKYFNDIKALGYETPSQINGLAFTIKNEGIDSPRISAAARGALRTIFNSRLGEQFSAEYNMIKELDPKSLLQKDKTGKVQELSKEGFILNKLEAIGSEFMYSKKSLEGYSAAKNAGAGGDKDETNLHSESVDIFKQSNPTVPSKWLEGLYKTGTGGSYVINAGNILVGLGDASKYSPKEIVQVQAAGAYKNADKVTEKYKDILENLQDAKDTQLTIKREWNMHGVASPRQDAEIAKLDKQMSLLNKAIKDEEIKVQAKYGIDRANALSSEGYRKSIAAKDSPLKLPESFQNVKSEFTPSTDKAVTVDGVKYLRGTFKLTADEYANLEETEDFDKKNYIKAKVEGNQTYYTVNGYLPINDDPSTLKAIDQGALGQSGYNKNQRKFEVEYAIYTQDKEKDNNFSTINTTRNVQYLQNEEAHKKQIIDYFNTKSTIPLSNDEEKKIIAFLNSPATDQETLNGKSLMWDLISNGGKYSIDREGNKINLQTAAKLLLNSK
jgi:hypothetical protein